MIWGTYEQASKACVININLLYQLYLDKCFKMVVTLYTQRHL